MFSEHRRQQHNYYNGVAFNGGGITPQFLPRPSPAPYFPNQPNSVIQNIQQSHVYKGCEQNDVKPQIDIKLYNSCKQKDVKPHIDIKPNKNSIDVLPSKYSNNSISSAPKNLTTEDLHVLKRVSHFETSTELSNERVKKWLSNKDASKEDYLDISINSEFKQSYGAEIYDEYQHQFLTFNTKGTGMGQNVIV